ncbi:hypothetical protein [Pseudoalteromonas piscicida]|uniref:Internalin n=1 Tax=Pseudoalteromonas piscicida TaxID=43662 RepID=A0AAD0RMX4_PSEO7|nr:hypothetical protein [Pseudoalteromonas piscicida]ASD69799.1 hypothetical protein B1L02_23490 [Pseudoalteromonas piscicida]AXR00423.1 hypothetical protein D0N37_23220 [Pseudoalteromonas piscicida]AXR04705.1 hypothetical protein D0511_22830 [Pseudoalteromonas piscicida]
MNLYKQTIAALIASTTPFAFADSNFVNEAELMQKAQNVNTFQSEIPGLMNDHIVLGTAYNSDQKRFLNVQTVAGETVETLGNTRVQFELVNNGSYDEVLRQLNGNVDVDVGFPVIRVKAGGHLAKEMSSTEFSNTYTFQASLTPKKRVLMPADANIGYTLTPSGNTLANEYQSKLMSMAGDGFISEIEYGAQLLINMKIEYLSEQHKSEIGGYLGVSYGAGNIGISVDGKLNYIDEDLKKSVRITVRALQKGGDPKQLLSIIPNNIITCSLDNYEPCFTLFEQAVNYAKNDFGNQFNALSDYNVVRYKATPYEISSQDVRRLDSGNKDIRFETTYRTLWLEDQFKKSVNHEHRARGVLAQYASWMTDVQRQKAEGVQEAAYNNAWIYEQYARVCRDNPYGTACTDAWNDYLNTCSGSGVGCIQNYTLADLNIPADNMTQYFKCENAREATANFGVEENHVSLGFRQLGWAPSFVDANDPAAGVMVWLPCKSALPTYGTAFEN